VVVILIFHVVGTGMELFKTAQGSWTYPEANLLRIGGVPLFSGFMYACVGSYVARAIRLLQIRFDHHPPLWATLALAVAAYVNFFTHHYGPDIRWALFTVSVLLFARTTLWFRPGERWLRMPMLLGFVLTALFIWLAENIGTFAAVWVYPAQRDGWSPVVFREVRLLVPAPAAQLCACRDGASAPPARDVTGLAARPGPPGEPGR
jgi:uncharacterized membrane protein YoaT (DUF817 family)